MAPPVRHQRDRRLQHHARRAAAPARPGRRMDRQRQQPGHGAVWPTARPTAPPSAAVDASPRRRMQELRHDGIRVASVAPGSVDTASGGGGRDEPYVAAGRRRPGHRGPDAPCYAACRAAWKSVRHNRRERADPCPVRQHREQLELHETMMGLSRGRLAVALDLLTDALARGSTVSTARARGCPASPRWTSPS